MMYAMPPTRLIIGCGYLGRRVAMHWLAEGSTVYALTRTAERTVEFQNAGLRPLIGDVTHLDSLPEFPAVDTLLYAVGLDRQSGRTQRDVYVGGLANVLPRLAGKVARAIYISSTSVYGQNSGEWVDESSPCEPDAANGKVCLEAERLFQQAIPGANILRLAGIYGPGRLVARLEALRAGLAPEGNPDAWLNLIHVADGAAAVLACEQRGIPGATYLVSDDRPCRRREYYSLLARLIGAPEPFPVVASGSEKPESHTPSEPLAAANLNKRCKNQRLRIELGVELRFPDITSGVPDALAGAD
jgi:nucleoside-diphosphate-sugar epimerase